MTLEKINEIKKDLDLLERISSDLRHFNSRFAFRSRNSYGAPQGFYFGLKKLFPFLRFVVTKDSIETEQSDIRSEVKIGPTYFESDEVGKEVARLRTETLVFLKNGIDEIYKKTLDKNKKIAKWLKE